MILWHGFYCSLCYTGYVNNYYVVLYFTWNSVDGADPITEKQWKGNEIKPFIYMTSRCFTQIKNGEEGQLISNTTSQCCNSDHIQ